MKKCCPNIYMCVFIFIYVYECVCIYIYIYISWPSVIEGEPKAPFSITTTPMYRGRCYSFPWIAPLYPWSVPFNVLSKEASSTIFWAFGMTRSGIEPWSSEPLANSQTIMLMGWCCCFFSSAVEHSLFVNIANYIISFNLCVCVCVCTNIGLTFCQHAHLY